jgi:DNA-binding HxlR family transcriptional regulator
MDELHRSLCAINLSLEIFGDRWSLLVIRDMMFGGKRHFRELLKSREGISSNILADRLGRLVHEGILTRNDDPTHKQKAIYSLTEKGIELLPIFVAVGSWGRRFTPATEELSWRADYLEKGGAERVKAFQDELRGMHLGSARGPGTPISDLLRSSTPPRLRRRAR